MRRALAVTVTVALATLAAAPASAHAQDGVRLSARFDKGVRLTEPTAMRIELRVDPTRHPTPISAMRVRYPASLGVATSGLGLAACRPSVRQFELVMVEGMGLGGCSPNSVMGRGDVRAQVRVGTLTIGATAYLTVLSGTVSDGTMGLVTYVIGQNPFGVRLAYAGQVTDAPPAHEQIAMAFPAIPGIPEDASFALTNVTMEIGSRRVTYRDPDGFRYHPDGIILPDRCPRGGFKFNAELSFQDGTQTSSTTTARCPPRAPREATLPPLFTPPLGQGREPQVQARAQLRGNNDLSPKRTHRLDARCAMVTTPRGHATRRQNGC